jgi:hypothetical protein
MLTDEVYTVLKSCLSDLCLQCIPIRPFASNDKLGLWVTSEYNASSFDEHPVCLVVNQGTSSEYQ